MTLRIRGSYDSALYKLTFYLLTYLLTYLQGLFVQPKHILAWLHWFQHHRQLLIKITNLLRRVLREHRPPRWICSESRVRILTWMTFKSRWRLPHPKVYLW